MVEVKCKLLKEIHKFEIDGKGPVADLRAKLTESLFLPADQKLKFKGKIVPLEGNFSEWADGCGEEGLPEGAMIMIMQ